MSKTTAILVCIAVVLVTGCSNVEKRRKHSLERLDWSGGTPEEQRLRDMLVQAIKSSDRESLATPRLVIARFYDASPTAQFGDFISVDWICEEPKADGIILTLADNSTRRLDFPKDYLDQNQKDAEEVVIFQATVDKIMNLQEGNTFEPEQVTSVALATNGVRVSNELGLKIVRQPKE